LGYTGFLVQAEREMDIEPNIYVHDNIVDLGPSNPCLQDSQNSLESFLLDTGSETIGKGLRSYVQGQIAPPAYAGRYGRAVRTRTRPLEVPRYEPNVWNADDKIRLHNNCYNYANNKITNTFAQPGRGSGQMFASLDPDEVARASIRDGLEGLADAEAWRSTPVDGHWAALVIWPPPPDDDTLGDYHWYRLDDFNAKWSHKPGQTAARDFDANGGAIADPRSAARGPYSTFVGFFHSFPTRITIS